MHRITSFAGWTDRRWWSTVVRSIAASQGIWWRLAFEMTRQACELVGWEYRLLGAPDQVVTANLRWLAGYRHPRYLDVEVADRLRAAFAEPVALMGGAAAAGDPIAALPVLFHLIWRHDLVIDLAVPLRGATPVRVGC